MGVRSEIIERAPLVAVPVSVIADWLEIDVVPGAANVNVEIWVVPNASIDSRSTMDMNDDRDDRDCPMGLSGPNEVTRCRMVDKKVDSGGRGCPTDFVSPNRARIGLMVHELQLGQGQWVRGCSFWVWAVCDRG